MEEPKKQPDLDETADDATATDEASAVPSSASAGDAAAAADADVTRLASEAELADLARLRTLAPRRRKRMVGFVGFLLLAFIAGLAVFSFRLVEDEISWPGEKGGTFDDTRRLLRVEDDVALLVYWPNGPQCVVTGDGTNLIDVITGVGARRDVPLHLNVRMKVLTNGLVTTTVDSYAAWKRARQKDGWLFDASSEKVTFLNEQESGYPAWQIDYGRKNGQSAFHGRALYIRHLDREIVLLRELSIAHWGRATALLDGYPCLAANLTAVRKRFEIPAVRSAGDFAEMTAQAYESVQNNFLSADWRLLDRMLRTLLLRSVESGDAQTLVNTKSLYAAFRLRLQEWYVRQCLAFQANSDPNPGKDRAFAAARTAIRRECAIRLPDECDCRQWRIAHDDWSVKR